MAQTFPIHRFERGTDGRTVGEEALAERRAAAARLEQREEAELPGDEHLAMVRGFVAKWTLEHPRGRRALVVCNSPTRVAELADWLRVALAEAEHPRQAVPPAMSALLMPQEELRDAERVRELAAYGIHEHHSHLRRDLRVAVEELFRATPGDDEPTLVLLATDTLAYGVNLALDTVVLSDVRFIEGLRRTGVSNRPLPPSRYHNIVGRAGRLGRMRERQEHATVYVAARAVHAFRSPEGKREGWFEGVVERYYGGAGTTTSALWMARDDTVQPDRPPMQRACLMSPPWITVVLDTLQYVHVAEGRPWATTTDMARLFDATLARSVFGGQWEGGVLPSVEGALAGMAEPEIGAVERSGEGWRLTPVGDAMLDCGASHLTVLSIRRALDRLEALWRRLGEEGPAPAWLCVLACLQDEWFAGRHAVRDEYDLAERATVSLRAGLEAWFDGHAPRATQPIRHLGATFQGLLAEYDVAGVPVRSRYERPSPVQAAASLLRLWLALQRWCAGDPWERVERILDEGLAPGHPRQQAERWQSLTRALTWSVRFLAMELAHRDPKDARSAEIESIALQIRAGSPPDVAALVLGGPEALRRKDAAGLHRARWSARRILREWPDRVPGVFRPERMPQLRGHLLRRWGSAVEHALLVLLQGAGAIGGEDLVAWWLRLGAGGGISARARDGRDVREHFLSVEVADACAELRDALAPRLVPHGRLVVAHPWDDVGAPDAFTVNPLTLGALAMLERALGDALPPLLTPGPAVLGLASLERRLRVADHAPPRWLTAIAHLGADADV